MEHTLIGSRAIIYHFAATFSNHFSIHLQIRSLVGGTDATDLRSYRNVLEWLQMMVTQPDILQDALPGSIVEYKSLDELSPKLPTNASLVCFPLHPKPHDADASWIKDFWHD